VCRSHPKWRKLFSGLHLAIRSGIVLRFRFEVAVVFLPHIDSVKAALKTSLVLLLKQVTQTSGVCPWDRGTNHAMDAAVSNLSTLVEDLLKMQNAMSAATKEEDQTPVELRELIDAVDALPAHYRDAVLPAMSRVVQCSTRRRRILNLVQEALSQLRLDMKYLIFDLEATRRERDEYREMLEQDGRL
jgi:hypothetical protein